MKLLHSADLHMDSAFAALDEDKAALRRSEQRGLLARMAELAAAEKVDAVLMCGDLLDSARSFAETDEALAEFCESVAAPVFIAPGNHDWYGPSSPYARLKLPENTHVFKSLEPESIELEAGNIWGAGWTSPTAPPLTGFRVPEGGINVMALHAVVGTPDGRYLTITEDAIGYTGLNYLALGHVHAYTGPRRSGGTVWCYPGCPEGRGFDETGEKGVVIADVTEKGTELRFVPVCSRRYEILSVEAGDDALAAVLAALPEGAPRDVYRLILTGETDVRPDTVALLAALGSRFFAVDIKDKTKPRVDIWAGTGEDTLRGAFLKRMRVRYEAAEDDDAREKTERAVRIGLAALENRDWSTI
ncbi:MAG: DNA repair exonuclease [Oscillospiraceae bacterium]|nr:DNA repair exonuclease [Oscillospiraceae bacterium]